jgi:hypothetical protein
MSSLALLVLFAIAIVLLVTPLGDPLAQMFVGRENLLLNQ